MVKRQETLHNKPAFLIFNTSQNPRNPSYVATRHLVCVATVP